MSIVVKKTITKMRKKLTIPTIDWSKGLSTGSTLVNMALTGKTHAGFSPGSYYLLVGDSQAGKSFLTLSTLAEAAKNTHYDDYKLVYDAPERGARMDISSFFGKKLADRLEYRYSQTVEDFYDSLDDLLVEAKPFIYVEDSESALSSEDEKSKYHEQKEARRKGKEAPGSYGDGKAKKHSSMLRQVITSKEFVSTGSILLLIAQTRDNIGFGAQFNPKTRSGGRALRFFATGELWFSIKGSIKRGIMGKQRKLGSILQVQVKKNRDTGREPTVELYHYPSFGFDDVGSMCSYLIDEGKWNGTDKKVEASDFGFSGSMEKLVQKIEGENREGELVDLMVDVWDGIEKACMVNRKKKYN